MILPQCGHQKMMCGNLIMMFQVTTNSLTTAGNIHYGTSNALFKSTARQQKPEQVHNYTFVSLYPLFVMRNSCLSNDDKFRYYLLRQYFVKLLLKRSEGGRRPTERSVFKFFFGSWLFYRQDFGFKTN